MLIIKITISLIDSYFPLIHSPSCARTVFYWTVCYRIVQKANHIQSRSLNQPITFKVVVKCVSALMRYWCLIAVVGGKVALECLQLLCSYLNRGIPFLS